jgi:hypothetical protein
MPLDLELAAGITDPGGSPLSNIGSAFGVPQCMLDLASTAAKFIPAAGLGQLSAKIAEGRETAAARIAQTKKEALAALGIFEEDGENGYRLKSMYLSEGLGDGLGELAGALGALTETVSQATELYTNVAGEIAGIKACLDQLSAFSKYQSDSKAVDPELLEAKFATVKAQVESTKKFINEADKALANIDKVLRDRELNPDLEPVFRDPSLSAFGLVARDPVVPAPDIYRLVFGPPKSTKGQFVFSVDGLYYDSQTGGLPPVIGFVPNMSTADLYKFDYPSNLGGKGEVVSLKTLDKYMDTVFDISKIDDSVDLLKHYNSDHFLNVLEGQRDKQIYDVSSSIQKLKDSSPLVYTEDSAMVQNLRQSMYSILSQNKSKIDRRKKQIEIAVKAPSLFGSKSRFGLGQVPINDFSYLTDLNLNVGIEKQKKLVFGQGEVSGVVLPIRPKYVKSIEAKVVPTIDSLKIPTVGKGSIIFDSDYTGVSGTILSLTDSIESTDMIAIYNFLEADVSYPQFTEYKTLNCNTKNNYNNAQLIAASPSSIFTKGLGIPYFNGIVKINNAGVPSGLGSFGILPPTPEFQNLMYKNTGFSIDFWVYAPNLGTQPTTHDPVYGYGTSSYHRLILGCENNGGEGDSISLDQAPLDYSSDTVRGVVMGFTRDRQITTGLQPSANGNDVSAGCFYLAPTRSVNKTDVAFINSNSLLNCASDYDVFKFTVPLSSTLSNGKSLFNTSGEFMHYCLTVSPVDEDISLYVDGELIKTSKLDVLGIQSNTSINAPTFSAVNSFNYNYESMGLIAFADRLGFEEYKFTPWIVGGGFSDGNGFTNNGFMGTNHGRTSGLKGHLGSLKFYSKPLTINEVVSNYKNQKGFFKNIDLS